MDSSVLYENLSASALPARSLLKSSSSHSSIKEEDLTTYVQMVNQSFEIYTTDDITTEWDSEIACYIKLSIKWPLELTNEL